MKKLKDYIRTMYRPSYIALVIGLAVFCAGLLMLSLDLHGAIAAERADIGGRFAAMLNELLYPMYILVPLSLLVDMNERRKKK